MHYTYNVYYTCVQGTFGDLKWYLKYLYYNSEVCVCVCVFVHVLFENG